jgi:hypothetical protein
MRMTRTSASVIAHPATRGIFRRRLSAIADPTTYGLILVLPQDTMPPGITYLCDIRCNDGRLCEKIEDIHQPSREVFSAVFCKVQPRHRAKLDA